MRRLVVLVCAVLATACLQVSIPTQPSVAIATPFDLKVGQSAVVAGDLTIRFDEVLGDSRCPMNALCVTAGEARIALKVSSGSRPSVRGEWRTNPNPFALSYGDYSIQLTALAPYPDGIKQIEPGDYVATLKVLRP